MFDGTVDANRVKTENSEKIVRAFPNMNTNENRPKKVWVDKGTEFAEDFSSFCYSQGIQFYTTMSEIWAAFAEPTIRSIKNVSTVS